jgi:hypothetical protein
MAIDSEATTFPLTRIAEFGRMLVMAPWTTLLMLANLLLLLVLVVAAVRQATATARQSGAIIGLTKVVSDFLAFLTGGTHTPTAITITQIQGDNTMAITGVTAGGNPGTFKMTPLPTGSAFPTGTTFVWTSSDSATALTPSVDGTSVAVAVAAADTAPSFDLTCTSSFTPPGAAAPLAKKVTVPILQPAVPTPTDMSIDQTA